MRWLASRYSRVAWSGHLFAFGSHILFDDDLGAQGCPSHGTLNCLVAEPRTGGISRAYNLSLI